MPRPSASLLGSASSLTQLPLDLFTWSQPAPGMSKSFSVLSIFPILFLESTIVRDCAWLASLPAFACRVSLKSQRRCRPTPASTFEAPCCVRGVAMVVIAHAGFLCKKDGVSAAWRRLWFEVKGYRLTYFQREDEFTLFNRSVAKRGQIRLEEVDVRRSQAADAESHEIEITDNQVRFPPRCAVESRSACVGSARLHWLNRWSDLWAGAAHVPAALR